MYHFGMCIAFLSVESTIRISPTSSRTVLIANNIRLMSKEMEPKVSINDLKKIRSFSRQRNLVSNIEQSNIHTIISFALE